MTRACLLVLLCACGSPEQPPAAAPAPLPQSSVPADAAPADVAPVDPAARAQLDRERAEVDARIGQAIAEVQNATTESARRAARSRLEDLMAQKRMLHAGIREPR